MWLMTRRPTDVTGEYAQAHHRLNRLMGDLMTGWPELNAGGTIGSAWVPPVDVFEDKEQLKIVAELPGVKVENVRISLENNTLSLSGEKAQVAEEQSERVHRYERSYGSFERTFSLPTTVDPERIQASMADGVLTVTLPKVEKARPREIPVTQG